MLIFKLQISKKFFINFNEQNHRNTEKANFSDKCKIFEKQKLQSIKFKQIKLRKMKISDKNKINQLYNKIDFHEVILLYSITNFHSF